MPRVLLLHQPVDGGVGRHVLDLYEGLSAQGYEPVACGPALPRRVSGGGGGLLTHRDGSPRRGEDWLISHVPLDMGRSVAPRQDLGALRRYEHILAQVKPALVHAHSSKAGALARLGALLRPGLPVLYTPHGFAFTGYFERRLERVAYREVERLLAPMARRVIAVCEAEARLARAVGLARRVRVIHNGIDISDQTAVEPIVTEIARLGSVICAVTLLRPGKGLETLIDAMPAVLARHPNTTLVIAGDGPLRAALQTRIDDRGLADAVRLLGEHPDPAAVLRGAHVFALPSLAESFPYVVLEAMAAGLPVVATDVGGVREALGDGEAGLLVRPRDPSALATALIRLLDDAVLRKRLGETGRKLIAQRFTRAKMIEATAAVYDEVTDGGPRR